MTKLLTCPNCGGDRIITQGEDKFGDDNSTVWRVSCLLCATRVYSSISLAAARAAFQMPAARRDAERKALEEVLRRIQDGRYRCIHREAIEEQGRIFRAVSDMLEPKP
jgi:hypothetical protein